MARRFRRGLVSHFAVRLYVYSADTGTSPSNGGPDREFSRLLRSPITVASRMLKKEVSRGHDSAGLLTVTSRLYLSDAQPGVPFFNAGKGPSVQFIKRRFRR